MNDRRIGGWLLVWSLGTVVLVITGCGGDGGDDVELTCQPACRAGYTCENGSCVEDGTGGCTPECRAGYTCQGGQCVEDGAGGCDPECRAGYRCDNGQCVSRDRNDAGDVGKRCDPTVPQDQNGCNVYCLEIAQNEGVCIDACGPDGSNPCQGPDVKCNEIPDTEDGGTVHICMPNGSCGDLSFQGRCDGDVVHKCGPVGPLQAGCSQKTGENGQPMQCAVVSEEYGANCVSSAYNGGCGDVTTDGRCDGNTLVYCQSAASGTIERRDCGSEATCKVNNGAAECVPDGGGQGCGNVSADGQCRGDVYVRCDTGTSSLERTDCTTSGQTCGWIDDRQGWGCKSRSKGGQYTVQGTFFFEDRPPNTGGLGPPRELPIPKVIVQVRDRQNNLLGSTHTAHDGTFQIDYPKPNGDVHVVALAASDTRRYSFSIRDCPSLNCQGGGNVYSAGSDWFTPDKNHDVGGLTVPASGVGPAFNIAQMFVIGFDFAHENIGETPPTVTGHWKRGTETPCGNVSCFLPRYNAIAVAGQRADPDPYDDYVLGHEFGHFLETAFSRTDSPGGAHDGTPTDPLLAWGEGYGTFVGITMIDDPVYRDTKPSGGWEIRLTRTRYKADPYDSAGQNQLVSEFMIAELLWHISNGGRGNDRAWDGRVFDVLSNYFPTSRLVDRGVTGVDFVDFLDGWFCRGHGQQSMIRGLVNQDKGFPYDYGGPNSCR